MLQIRRIKARCHDLHCANDTGWSSCLNHIMRGINTTQDHLLMSQAQEHTMNTENGLGALTLPRCLSPREKRASGCVMLPLLQEAALLPPLLSIACADSCTIRYGRLAAQALAQIKPCIAANLCLPWPRKPSIHFAALTLFSLCSPSPLRDILALHVYHWQCIVFGGYHSCSC